MSKHTQTEYDPQYELDCIQREAHQFMLRVLVFCERQQSFTTETSPILQAMEQSSIALKSVANTFVILASQCVCRCDDKK